MRAMRTALAVALLVVAACSGGGDDDGHGATQAATTTLAGAGTTAGPGGPGTATTGPGGGTGTTAPADPTAPRRLTPPDPGTYTYAFERDGGQATPARLGVEGVADGRQEHTFSFEAQRRILAFGETGQRLERTIVATDPRYGGGGYECDWTPDPETLRVPSAAGTSWSSEATCDFTVGGQPARQVASETREVTAIRDGTVGGQPVTVLEVRRRATVTGSGAATFTQTTTGTDLYDVRTGLLVQSVATVEVDRPQPTTTRIVLRLLRLGPA